MARKAMIEILSLVFGTEGKIVGFERPASTKRNFRSPEHPFDKVEPANESLRRELISDATMKPR